MLLSSLIETLQDQHAELQAQIDALQAKQREVQVEIQGAGVRESRMESCLALLQEVIRESEGRPEELQIFKDAVDASFSSPVVHLLAPSDDQTAAETPSTQPEEEQEPIETAAVEVEESPAPTQEVPAKEEESQHEQVKQATMKQLNSLPIGKLRALARSRKLVATGTAQMLVTRLWGAVSLEEFSKIS